MTREKAKKRIGLKLNVGHVCYEIIDNIFDDIESQICDNCRHINIRKFRTYEMANCTNDKCVEMFDCDVGSDFGCNKWESK